MSNDVSCCASFTWVFERDLDSAEHFDLALGRCGSCGKSCMSVYCEASQVTGYEPVGASDAERMRSLPAGPERKALIRKWVRENT